MIVLPGQPLGFKMKQGEGKLGASVKSVDEGGQASHHPGIMPGMRITHINGTQITEMTMARIGALIRAQLQVGFTFEALEGAAAETTHGCVELLMCYTLDVLYS